MLIGIMLNFWNVGVAPTTLLYIKSTPMTTAVIFGSNENWGQRSQKRKKFNCYLRNPNYLKSQYSYNKAWLEQELEQNVSPDLSQYQCEVT